MRVSPTWDQGEGRGGWTEGQLCSQLPSKGKVKVTVTHSLVSTENWKGMGEEEIDSTLINRDPLEVSPIYQSLESIRIHTYVQNASL